MDWCYQATSLYLSQCWPGAMLPYGITGPQGVNEDTLAFLCKTWISGSVVENLWKYFVFSKIKCSMDTLWMPFAQSLPIHAFVNELGCKGFIYHFDAWIKLPTLHKHSQRYFLERKVLYLDIPWKFVPWGQLFNIWYSMKVYSLGTIIQHLVEVMAWSMTSHGISRPQSVTYSLLFVWLLGIILLYEAWLISKIQNFTLIYQIRKEKQKKNIL